MNEEFQPTLRKAWNEYDAYLFDIDGTLIVSEDPVHYQAFCHALEMLSGQPMNLDGVRVHGNTDIGILRDALISAGIEAEQWRPHKVTASDAMGRFVTERKGDLRVQLLPGVYETLTHLSGRGATLGVATGNLQVIGKLKLEAAGISHFFTCGSYSDKDEYRQDVFRRALTSVHKQIGETGVVCILGDTPEDVRAARHNGVDSIAVATGIYTTQELKAEGPNKCCSFLTELLT